MNFSEAADHFGLSWDTIQNWLNGKHGPVSKGQAKKRHLPDDQEEVLCDWILHMAETGKAMSKQALCANVMTILAAKI